MVSLQCSALNTRSSQKLVSTSLVAGRIDADTNTYMQIQSIHAKMYLVCICMYLYVFNINTYIIHNNTYHIKQGGNPYVYVLYVLKMYLNVSMCIFVLYCKTGVAQLIY